MYEGIAILKSDPVASYDEYGNEVLTYTEKEVYVKPRSVYASEFYSAATLGITPSIVLVLSNRSEYDNQKLIDYEGKTYEVVRADWANKSESVALTLAERIGDND